VAAASVNEGQAGGLTGDAPSLPADEIFDETTPVPASVQPIPVDAGEEPGPDSVEEVEALEDVLAGQLEVPPAEHKPPPPRRSAKPSLPRAQKIKAKPWWETLFGDDFSRAYRPMTSSQVKREVDFIESALQLPQGSVILDLACGQGEICVELSQRGYSVVGYDLSVYQLAMAGDNAQIAKQKINFLQGDMREMAFDQMFDAVLCWDTSFGYFEEEKNLDVLRRVKAALKPSGRFLLDVLNRDFVAREAPYNHWFEGDGCVCMDDMSMDWITNRLRVKRSIILDDGRSKELEYSVRLYGLSDVGRMLHDVGFRVSGVSGDVCTKGAFFGPSSRRIIMEAGKP
jgi:SAM-dependent methyltransferase